MGIPTPAGLAMTVVAARLPVGLVVLPMTGRVVLHTRLAQRAPIFMTRAIVEAETIERSRTAFGARRA